MLCGVLVLTLLLVVVQVFHLRYGQLKLCVLHIYLAGARIIWIWFCEQVALRETTDPEVRTRFKAWLKNKLGRLTLLRAYNKDAHAVNPYVSGDDADALFVHFESALVEVFGGDFVVALEVGNRDWQWHVDRAKDMHRLIRALYQWSKKTDKKNELEWAKKNHRNVVREFRTAFRDSSDPNYLHMLEEHLDMILEAGPLYPYAADSHESAQGKFKKWKTRFTNEGGGRGGTERDRWGWIEQMLVRHGIKQEVVFTCPSFTPQQLLKETKRKYFAPQWQHL